MRYVAHCHPHFLVEYELLQLYPTSVQILFMWITVPVHFTESLVEFRERIVLTIFLSSSHMQNFWLALFENLYVVLTHSFGLFKFEKQK